ncbi:MAG: hypothetical protein C0404_06245 [Verrucomicrobia bacterium]|nr:hypothetical protein [Verrucomicrobiota bacterium]
MLEMLLAVSIVAVISLLAYLSFSTVIKAWQNGMALSDELHHGDFVMEQLVAAMRSSYYPDSAQPVAAYGFSFDDSGLGESSDDSISWVKLGSSLVGRDCPFAGTPHRVMLTMEPNEEGKNAIAVRAWRVFGEQDEFDPKKKKPIFLSDKVTGFNCRMTEPFPSSGKIEWLDEWKDTNRVPPGVEITLYLQPLEEGGKAIELKRVIGIPIAPLSWKSH